MFLCQNSCKEQYSTPSPHFRKVSVAAGDLQRAWEVFLSINLSLGFADASQAEEQTMKAHYGAAKCGDRQMASPCVHVVEAGCLFSCHQFNRTPFAYTCSLTVRACE